MGRKNMLGEGVKILLLGMAVVFSGLVIIIFLTKVMSALARDRKAKSGAEQAAAQPVAAAAPAQPIAQTVGAQPEGESLYVVAAAAIAASLDKKPDALNVVSIQRVN